jgi:hypothetical protein
MSSTFTVEVLASTPCGRALSIIWFDQHKAYTRGAISASRLVNPTMARARKAATAPNQPTARVICAVKSNLRILGVMIEGSVLR